MIRGANNPFSGLLNIPSSSNVKELKEKVESFKNFVQKSKISHHVVGDLLNFCTWMKERSDLDLDIEEECIVPIVKFFLEDGNQEVNKTAYSHLAIMINRGKITKKSLENHFCTYLAKVINDLFEDDFRLQAINTIFELIYYIDKEVIAKEIIPEISKLCLNPNTDKNLKTACVSRLDKLASRLERDLTEKNIIPLYEKMSNDKYKIRKNCVEVSVALSYICSKEIREEILVPIYISFLEDSKKHVSELALIALGPFIASFANTEQSEHHETFNEVLVNNIYNFNYGKINIDFNLTNTNFSEDFDYLLDDCKNSDSFDNYFISDNDHRQFNHKDYRSRESRIMSSPFKKRTYMSQSTMIDVPRLEIDSLIDSYLSTSNADEFDVKEAYNDFNYWREPLMNIDEILDADEKNSSEQDKDDDCMEVEVGYNRLAMINQFDDLDKIYRMQKEDLLVSNIEKCLKLLKGTTVPKELLFHFLKSLVISNYCSNVYQADINCICAFSLPAVAYTLGEENWPCLRIAFNLLVVGLSTNIRLILASSLHEIAKIIGPVYANRDILPALFTFMDQSDEIRERILKNLSLLVNIFDKAQQKMILRKLTDFYKLDNGYNWRFKVEFINQFKKLVKIYDKPKQFSQIIIPMIFSLLEDQVAEVRKSTIPLLSLTIQHLYDLAKQLPYPSKIRESIIDQIYYKLYLSKKWSFRQLFIMVCDNIVQTFALPIETFEEKLLTPLLNLSKDKVHNVRLTLSRVLSNELFIKCFDESVRIKIEETIELLTQDQDKDVRSHFLPPAIVNEQQQNQYAMNFPSMLPFDDAESDEFLESHTNALNNAMINKWYDNNSLNGIEALTNRILSEENNRLDDQLKNYETTLNKNNDPNVVTTSTHPINGIHNRMMDDEEEILKLTSQKEPFSIESNQNLNSTEIHNERDKIENVNLEECMNKENEEIKNYETISNETKHDETEKECRIEEIETFE